MITCGSLCHLEDLFDVRPGVLVSARHDGGPPPRPLLAAAHAGPNEQQPLRLQGLAPGHNEGVGTNAQRIALTDSYEILNMILTKENLKRDSARSTDKVFF